MEIGEAEIEAAHRLSSPPEHPLLPRLRHRRLMAFLRDQGFNESYNEFMNKTRAHMSLSHLRCLVERGRWEDATEYLERYLPPATPTRPRSLRAQVLRQFLLMHHRFAKAVDGSVDKFVPRNYLQLSNGRAVSHAELRLRSISFCILAVDEVRANMNWQAVRNKASLVVYRLAHSTPELRGCIELPATSNKPHHVLPIASRLWSRRRYVKKKQTGLGRTKAIIRALEGQSLMVPKIGSVEEAQEFLADLLDETVRDGVQLITYGQCRPLQPGGNEGAQSCQPMLDTFRVAKTYRTFANAGTNKLLAEPGSHPNTARQDLDGTRNSREEPAIVEEGHGPKRQRSTGAFGEASLVLVKNTDNNVGRIVKAVVLDRPSLDESQREHPDPVASTSSSDNVMGFLPTRSYPANGFAPLEEDVAYVSPLLAFNLGVHVSSLKLLIQKGEQPFKFCSKLYEDGAASSGTGISLHLELLPCPQVPRYALHLRVSVVRIPDCGVLASLKINSASGGSDYQDMIDQGLNEYFKFDRILARGDVFCIHNDWNCGMISCLACNKENDRLHPSSMVYFKVTGMEPSDDPILRVNCDQTALVLGGSASAPVPPCSFFAAYDDSVPLHGEIVEQLASIISPALCPSNILPRIKFSTFLYGPSGCGKRTVVRHVANYLGMHVVECCCHDLMTSSESGASAALVAAFKEAQKYSPCIILLRHFDAIGNTSSNEGPQSEQSGIAANVESVIKQYTGQRWVAKDSLPARDVIGNSYLVEPECVSSLQVILVATADSAEGMHQSVRRCFRHEINMKTINEDQRKNLISETLHGVSAVADESINDKFVKDMSVQTSGFMPRDILALIADAGVSFAHKVAVEKSSNDKLEDIVTASSSTTQNEENHFSKEDILSSLERAKKRNRAALGTPKVPDVKWEDVGGLEEVKKVILDTIQLPLMYKHLFSSKLPKRSGVLLYGPPGTGKTLLAKAVATECSLNFLSVKGPELINMYVGESEKNVRDIFEKARSARPCVIFFDELDSLAPARGSSADSGGVMDRVVSQLLVEIDGLSDNSQDLFIIGATNRPDLLDSALLRPGRFDKLLYVGVNTEASYRERILKAQTRKYKLHKNVSLLSIAQHCPPNFTGADIYALCADAWFHAAKRSVKTLEADPSRNNDTIAEEVIVEADDFMTVLGDISPSLTMEELQNYEQLRQKIEGPSR